MARPRLGAIRGSLLNRTIDENVPLTTPSNDESEFFAAQKLVQKTRLIKHSPGLNGQPEIEASQAPIRSVQQSDSENRQLIKEIAGSVMKGEGLGWFKLNRLKRLMEDESYRDLMLTQLNKNSSIRIRPDDRVSDVKVEHSVWVSMQKVCAAIVSGLEHSYMHNKLVGMASVFPLLDILHTHYWTREPSSEPSRAAAAASSSGDLGQILQEQQCQPGELTTRSSSSSSSANNDLLAKLDRKNSTSWSSSGGQMDRTCTINSEQDDLSMNDDSRRSSCLQDVGSDLIERFKGPDDTQKRRAAIERSADELEPSFVGQSANVSDSITQSKGTRLGEGIDLSSGRQQALPIGRPWNSPAFRQLHPGHSTLERGIKLAKVNEKPRVYLFEGFVKKDRSRLWDEPQFWEEAFLDAVSHERCLVGMDQSPEQMLEAYKMGYDVDKKRLEHEEDRLLSTILHNMLAFMLMLQVDRSLIKQKIRRLQAKCHIGLVSSAELNRLLEKIDNLKGNDIDLKPMASRQQMRKTFTLHQGTDSSGEVVFMEVRDDGIILRNLEGAMIERWWYERLINMTYSPKNKLVCFWRKSDGEIILSKYYTKKCHELYQTIKDSMQRVAAHLGTDRACLELGGEFPVLDTKSGEGGILQVCMGGVGLLFANSKVSNHQMKESVLRCSISVYPSGPGLRIRSPFSN